MIKKHIILIALIANSFFVKVFAQTDSIPKIKVNKTEVSVLYNQYIQEGDHSAVTGGIGTERLRVYGPSLKLNRTFGKNKIGFNLGSDIISSASTDNIDFIPSSASILDARTYSDIQYSRNIEKEQLILGGGFGFSIESDYFSLKYALSAEKQSKNKMQTYSANFEMYRDDLRWGRLDADYKRPVRLIYPRELRNQEWYDIYHRNSYNLQLGFTQIIDRRNILGIFSRLSYQEGLLATPFHRVYFTDGSRAVELLPRERYKGSLTLQWNRFLGGGIILKNTVNGYADNFEIRGLALENETVFKLNAKWILAPHVRIYWQEGSRYFQNFGQHDPGAEFYTSDFDHSTFRSYKAGLSARYKPFKKLKNNARLNIISLNYHFYYRTDGLRAHVISMNIDFEYQHPSRKK